MFTKWNDVDFKNKRDSKFKHRKIYRNRDWVCWVFVAVRFFNHNQNVKKALFLSAYMPNELCICNENRTVGKLFSKSDTSPFYVVQ